MSKLKTRFTEFVATSKILGRKTAGGGAGEELSLSEILDFIGSAAEGDILYRGASNWARLPKGTNGQIITLASNIPSWTDALGSAAKKIFAHYTWLLADEIKVPSGDTDYINPMHIVIPSGWTYKVTNVRYRINSGTSVTFSLKKNGSTDLTGFTSLSATTTAATTTPTAVDLSNNDYIAPVVTAVSGTPKNLSITITIEKFR